MKTAIRTTILCICVLMLSAFCFSAEPHTPEISSAIENVIDNYINILPENSSLLGVQPEAYIGKLFPSVPPHFTAGISVSGTFLDTSFLSDGMKDVSRAITGALSDATGDTISISLNVPERIPYPAASVSARIGGIVLPFDIGLHAVTTVGGMFDSMDFGDANVSSDYTTLGADIRCRVYEESLFIPQISLGGGYLYSKHTLALGAENNYILKNSGAAEAANLATQFDMSVATHTIFVQIQASKKIAVLTPFIGLRALFTKADCEYGWQYETKIDGEKNGYPSDRGGREYTVDFSDTGLNTQVFGGIGLQIALFQLGLTVSYNFGTKYISGAVLLDFKM